MGKTIKERIARFCAKYPEPRQYKMELTWRRKDGYHVSEIGSGEELLFTQWARNMYRRSTCKQTYIQHYRYDEETELMECSYAAIDCHVPKKGENRRWVYAERYFIPKEEKVVYDICGNTDSYVIHQSYEWKAHQGRTFLQGFTRLGCQKGTFKKEFDKLTDGKITVPPRYDNSTHVPWILTEWIRYNARPLNKNGKTQQRIDKMLDKVLDDENTIINKFKEHHNKADSGYGWYYNHRLAYFDKANMVFRLFYKYGDVYTENKRVYMDGKKFLFATLKDGKWATNGSFTSSQFGYAIINMEDVYSLPHCAYLRNFEIKTVHKVVSVMRNAEIEQLHNMGFTDLATNMIRNDSVVSGIKDYIGEPDKKKKNVCQRYHLTRAQLEYLNRNSRSYSYNGRRLAKMKEILGTNDLSHIDIETFKKYYNITNNTWHLRIFDSMTPEDKKKLFTRIANMSAKNENAMQIFYDTYNMSNNYNIDIMNIRTYDELVRAHDAAMEIRRIEQEERQRLYAMKQEERHKELEKKMEKLDKERKELNYEEDEFIIRIPEKLSEIVTEGNALRHCVGGYTERHAMGSTTILFLRRKSEIDKPFYTIEVNRGNVVQIHGFGNRWLGCNPEAIPTVARWLKKNNIHCTDQILRSKATGYCGNHDLVPMPAI